MLHKMEEPPVKFLGRIVTVVGIMFTIMMGGVILLCGLIAALGGVL